MKKHERLWFAKQYAKQRKHIQEKIDMREGYLNMLEEFDQQTRAELANGFWDEFDDEDDEELNARWQNNPELDEALCQPRDTISKIPYLQSDAYKNEEWEVFNSVEEMAEDHKKYHNL
jgi:hypothetical protein